MSPVQITGQVLGAEQVVARFNIAGPKAKARIQQAVQTSGLEVLAHVKQRKLSGQVLNVRTGRLRRSINEKFQDAGDTMSSNVGTNVTYGRFWELGYKGPVKVKEHTRLVKMAWGRTLANPVEAKVGAFTRNLNIKARPFLVPALDENRDRIRQRLAAATVGVL